MDQINEFNFSTFFHFALDNSLAKVLGYILDYMGHRLGTVVLDNATDSVVSSSDLRHIDLLLCLGLSLTVTVLAVADVKSLVTSQTEAQTTSTKYNLPLKAQTKFIRNVATRLLSHLFESELLQQKNAYWSEVTGRLDAVREVCLCDALLNQLTNSAHPSTNHLLLTLAVPWSTSAHLTENLLLADGTAFKTMMRLLLSPNLNDSTAERVMQILFNLLFLPGK